MKTWVWPLAVIAAIGLGFGVGRSSSTPSGMDEVVQRLDLEQRSLQSLEARMKSIESGLQLRASPESPTKALRSDGVVAHVAATERSSAKGADAVADVPQLTPENFAAKTRGEQLLNAAIAAGQWTFKDEAQFRRALVRMSASDRDEMMSRLAIATNNQQLSDASNSAPR